MEQHSVDPAPFSLGLILFGYLLILPFWAVGALWNRAQPKRALNPWILPGLACLLLEACFVINYFNHQWREDYPMTALAVLPAALGCLVSGVSWRRPETDESITDLHR